jgi:transposase-like protein
MPVKQHIPKALRYTHRDVDKEFPDDDACLDYLMNQRWPGGVTYCEKCQQERKHYRIRKRTAYSCDHCGTQIYPLAGTILEKTTTPLKTWLYAMFLMGSTRCGISAKQIQRECGVTYKTAWRMFKQIRTLLSEGDLQLEGPTVEMDETYVGGVQKGRKGHPPGYDGKKTPVVAIVQRRGKVIAKAIPEVSSQALMGLVTKQVISGSTIYTDELAVYNRVKFLRTDDGIPLQYRHRRIKHSDGVYVKGVFIPTPSKGFGVSLRTGFGAYTTKFRPNTCNRT